jgi:hypothetical protein
VRGVVYFLADPGEPLVPRYVGQTWDRLEQRLGEHIRSARRGSSTYSARWIRTILDRGLRPEITVLSSSSTKEGLSFQERAWIDGYRAGGARLCNLTDGGEGNLGWNPSAETRARIGAASRGRKHTVSAEARERIAAAHRGRKLSAGHLAKLSAAHRGKKNLAVSEANRNRVGSKWSASRRAAWERRGKATK